MWKTELSKPRKGILNRLLGKHNSPAREGTGLSSLAFVLLSEAQLPSAREIVLAFRDFAASEPANPR